MLKISRLADYGVVVMRYLAFVPDRSVASAEVGACTWISLPTVRKVMKQLSSAGLIVSEQGATGGYRLARKAGEITVANMIAAIDGETALTDCSISSELCDKHACCDVRLPWQRINKMVTSVLEGVSLEEMMQ